MNMDGNDDKWIFMRVELSFLSQILFSPFLIPSTTTNFNFEIKCILCYIHQREGATTEKNYRKFCDKWWSRRWSRKRAKKIEMKFNSSKALSCSTCVWKEKQKENASYFIGGYFLLSSLCPILLPIWFNANKTYFLVQEREKKVVYYILGGFCVCKWEWVSVFFFHQFRSRFCLSISIRTSFQGKLICAQV